MCLFLLFKSSDETCHPEIFNVLFFIWGSIVLRLYKDFLDLR